MVHDTDRTDLPTLVVALADDAGFACTNTHATSVHGCMATREYMEYVGSQHARHAVLRTRQITSRCPPHTPPNPLVCRASSGDFGEPIGITASSHDCDDVRTRGGRCTGSDLLSALLSATSTLRGDGRTWKDVLFFNDLYPA